MRRGRMRFVTGVVLLTVALGGVGCTPVQWVASAACFVSGWIARDLALGGTGAPTCYRNGEIVDCATIPTDLQPGAN
ncbi:MAG TPA: hypothetical protein PLP66_15960 [Phycisphaerae bacterium]|nr:hypothetical protein [Phycisphaerae bacterium]HQL53576.1 hypothetical protein [Phycisphaerae bacterium]